MAMTTDEFSKEIADKVILVLEKSGYFERVSKEIANKAIQTLQEVGYFSGMSQKDNLTDVAQNISTAPANPQPAVPAGTVVAHDGTIVTLGQDNKQNTNLSSPSEGMNLGKK